MSGDEGGPYHHRHRYTRAGRRIVSIALEDMYLAAWTPSDYAAALPNVDRDSALPKAPRIFATCLSCLGYGLVENPDYNDEDPGNEKETLECESCRATGWVEIKDPPPPVQPDDDLPF